MIEALKQHISGAGTTEDKVNRTREFLQLTALKIMFDKHIFDALAFVGGTALRILFDLRRFSEDLDFSLVHKKHYHCDKLNNELLRGFSLYGLEVESKPQNQRTVHSIMLKFPGLLNKLGLSPLKGQKLSIKLEVDTNPPAGWNLTNTVVNKIYLLDIVHPDLPSLYATKLHACFYRTYTKGRDIYDLIWYLGKGLKPNFAVLNNAIKQSQDKSPGINSNNLQEFLLEKLGAIDFNLARKDVERFLEDKRELALFETKLLKNTIKRVYGA